MAVEEEEPIRKGRSNAIMTYEEIASIHLSIQKVGLAVERLDEKLDAVAEQHVDHEVRIRALELTSARSGGGHSLAQWATPVLLSFGMALLGVLNYVK